VKQLETLSEFFTAVECDPRISITHIGIFAALLQYWQKNNFSSPVRAYSYQIMQLAKISASTTYHKTIRELSEYGYIKYEPSFKRNQPSKIYLAQKRE
jgi:hypothetical protein